ncbi:unnamed protein product [Psylliodes chrysocephalus]|uniref:YqaJ viral recombinase domain-containing protein n=1 Tax=Psylliodes chrysocephalus TaxID=3402493 RepID=A0A9P0CY65_9CUCU|nr:unnamed protein product [Psylliodes chrysocephala]
MENKMTIQQVRLNFKNRLWAKRKLHKLAFTKKTDGSVEVKYSKDGRPLTPGRDIQEIINIYETTQMDSEGSYQSARKHYGDNAVGYVQLKRTNNICYLKARVTPEHKIKAKNYQVSCVINELEKKVVEVNCHDCPASEGGCKHAVAFLMWVHRRSEEPSPTDKVCYWKRSVLAGASSTKKFITTEDFGAKPSTFSNDSFLNQYIVEAKKRKIENSTMRYHISQNYDCVSLHRMKIDFMSTNNINDAYIFLDYCKQQMDEDLLKQIEIKTRNQSRCSLWSEMRYARITASKAYDAAHCATLDGTLVENILGAKVFQTEAMKRGLDLEEAVLKVLSKETSQIFHKCGLFLSQECPVIGASPDAINEEYVVEIKCPFLDKTFHNFIDVDGTTGKICKHQSAVIKNYNITSACNVLTEKSKIVIYKIATGIEPTQNMLLPLKLEQCYKKTNKEELEIREAEKNINNNNDTTLLKQNLSIRFVEDNDDEISINPEENLDSVKDKWSSFINKLDGDVRKNLNDDPHGFSSAVERFMNNYKKHILLRL